MFKNIFSFEGRIRRTEYGVSLFIHWIFSAVLNTIIATTLNKGLFLLYIPSLWFLSAQGAKRCHDLSKNGWWQIIPLYSLWLIFQDGFHGINEYGPSPKYVNVTNNFQNYSNHSTKQPNVILNQPSPYEGGYDGGHNAIGKNDNNIVNSNVKSHPTQPMNGGYNNGDLYN